MFGAGGAPLKGTVAAGVPIDASGSINKDIQLAALDDGGFVVAYTDNEYGAGTDISAQVFNADGSARTLKFLVNGPATGGSTAGDQSLPSVTPFAHGFAVSWKDSGNNTFVQAFDADGHARGTALPFESGVLETEIVGQHDAELIGLSQSVSGASIVAHGAWIERSIEGDAGGETIHAPGDEMMQSINGRGGDDTIILAARGLDSFELIDGGAGDDTVVFTHAFTQYEISSYGTLVSMFGLDGAVSVANAEHLEFTDRTIDVNGGLVDNVFYLSHNLDVFQAGRDAAEHFNTQGWHEDRDPNPLFDVSFYLAVNPDVAASGVNPLEHYHQTGWREGRDPGPNFDTTSYLMNNPDVAAAGVDPLEHFLRFGTAEERWATSAIGSPINGFDAEYYVLHNADVAAAGVDPLQHFRQFGWHEDRDPNHWFDTSGYLAHYADVAAAGVNPLEHYMQIGWKEGRDPSEQFDTLGYLKANPDVAASGTNPLEHYLEHGIYEHRQVISDWQWH